jgi:hypothetical protein
VGSSSDVLIMRIPEDLDFCVMALTMILSSNVATEFLCVAHADGMSDAFVHAPCTSAALVEGYAAIFFFRPSHVDGHILNARLPPTTLPKHEARLVILLMISCRKCSQLLQLKAAKLLQLLLCLQDCSNKTLIRKIYAGLCLGKGHILGTRSSSFT